MYSKTPPSTMNKRPREDSGTESPRKSPFGIAKMFLKTPPSTMNKRPHDDSSIERPRKSPVVVAKVEDDALGDTKIFKFRILLPNGTTLELKMSEFRSEIPIKEFIDFVREEYLTVRRRRTSPEPKRRINWKYQDLHFTDAHTNKIRIKVNFRDFMPNMWHFLWLHDGSAEPDAYEGMWDLTPDTDLLNELPNDYTFETALADLIDNSLQALWSLDVGKRRLISVELRPTTITIFDSGPGMDGTDGNLVKWGKMGASLHRSARGQAIGGKPPYLMPFFGMFGHGGPVATMCLGRRAVVSSKTRNCSKVFTLHLEREALMNASSSENCWRTKGGVRDSSEDEKEKSSHGSFTKVEIFELKMKTMDVKQFRCKLKDIYFPYIQCDEMYGKTSRPIEFQVNGKDLAGIQGGEVATTNMHSCNGPNFVVQLHLSINQDASPGQRQRVVLEANARLKCVYFPINEGEESIMRIIDKLNTDGCGIGESFESFCRVSVRRLGRLLPDTRWALLPFMEPKQKKGEKAQMLKRCCSRVKCFIDTDSGFNPTPYKTDLAYHHPYTKALKNFGNRMHENEKEVQIEIFRDGKKLTLPQLEKQYNDWVTEMHENYDGEIDGGLDQPTTLVVTSKIKKLGIYSDVLRVHKTIQRKGKCWTAGQKIKVLKGACSGCHKNNVFATLEYIILEGLRGEACGEARLICRPLGLPEEKGCHLLGDNENWTIDIRDSLALPISVIDSDKCIAIDDMEWGNKLEMYRQKSPSAIDLLSHINCQELDIEGGLPPDVVEAGVSPPENIVAVIRPKAFNSKSSSKRLDQKFIVRENLEMTVEVKFRAGDKNVGKYEHIYSLRISPSSHKGLHGLYLFPVKLKCPNLFQKAGFYTFSLSMKELRDLRVERVVQVQASAEGGSWKVVRQKQDAVYTARAGSCCEPLSVACYDRYNNRVLFTRPPKLRIDLSSSSTVLAQIRNMKVDVTTDKSTMIVKDIIIASSELDKIRSKFEATLNISTIDKAFSVAFPCRVIPGTAQKITVHPPKLGKQLIPGQIIEEFALEVFDQYGNHAKEDENILLHVDGFSFQDGSCIARGVGITYRKVDANGFVDLSNFLKVSKGYGKDVFLCVKSKETVILELNFQTELRELQTVSKVFKNCDAGSRLENIVFEIVNSKGNVDESIHDEEKHGQSHTLTIKSNSFDIDDSVRYSFRHGRCTIRSISLPQTEGIFSFSAAHSCYPELNLDIEVHVDKIWRENHDNIWNHEGVENPVFSPQNSCENLPSLPCSSSLNVSEAEHENFPPQSSNRNVSPTDHSPSLKTPKLEHSVARNENSDIFRTQVLASQDLGDLDGPAWINRKDIGDDLLNRHLTMTAHERKLEILKIRRSHTQQYISDLQASIDRDLPNFSSTSGKELIIQLIKSKSQSAAAVICKWHEKVPIEARPDDILGVVALLGTVPSIKISRVLARYLGEDQMLAIVCKNYAAAYDLETNALQAFATKFGQSISGGYLALCLEDIRPFISETSCDPPWPLRLPKPTLANGDVPKGFLGHAVNMISIESSHLHWRAKSGHCLRETLFYRLFGELQVYEDRECMMMAESCIKDGAVSMDGGITRGNGLVSLGHWEPDVMFPVKNDTIDARCFHNIQLMEAKKLELEEINHQLEEQNEACERDGEKYQRALSRYSSFISKNGSSAGGTSQQR